MYIISKTNFSDYIKLNQFPMWRWFAPIGTINTDLQ